VCELPAATCDGSMRKAPVASVCSSDGGCEFQWVETPCPNGCTGGMCDGAPCYGVVCNQPPQAACVDTTTLHSYQSLGTCNATNGQCSYTSSDLSCSAGCAGGHCNADKCAGVVCTSPRRRRARRAATS
jgi:hypothetical protein